MRKQYASFVVSVLMVLALLGATTNASHAAQKPEGDFAGKLDVGGYNLFIDVQGERQKGSPTVVFENGNGDTHEIWNLVAPVVAKQTRVVTYDRVGRGQSDAPARELVDYSAKGEATRLHTLLKNAHVEGPVILAVHSIGGIYAREYQSLYPDQVKGIVFVEPATEHQDQYLYLEYDADMRQWIMEMELSDGTMIPVELSFADFIVSSAQLDAAQATDPLRNLPITVLSSGNHGIGDFLPYFEQHWAERQAYVTSLSDKAVHTIDADHGHYLHQQNPQLVIAAITAMIDRVKE